MLKGVLCRAILFPKCFVSGVFDDMALMQLFDVNGDGSVYALSVASRFALKDEAGAHGYGCRTADRLNEAFAVRNGHAPPTDKTTFYLGFYDIEKDALLSISSAHYTVGLRHHVEHGERSHFNLEFTNVSTLGTGKANDRIRRQDRQVAIMQAVSKMSGPARYDRNDNPEIVGNLELPTLPREASA